MGELVRGEAAGSSLQYKLSVRCWLYLPHDTTCCAAEAAADLPSQIEFFRTRNDDPGIPDEVSMHSNPSQLQKPRGSELRYRRHEEGNRPRLSDDNTDPGNALRA